MKRKLTRLLSLLCLVATVATCLVIVPMTVSAANGIYSYGDIKAGPSSGGDCVSFFGGGMSNQTTSIFELIKNTTVPDSTQTYYDAYFKQFETAGFQNGLDNKEADGYAEAMEICVNALLTFGKPGGENAISKANTAISPSKFDAGVFDEEGAGLWAHFDYYFDDKYDAMRQPKAISNIIRFNAKAGFYLVNSGSDGKVYQTRTLNPYNMTGDPVVIENDGWNRISVFFSQNNVVTEPSGDATEYTLSTTYTMTIYINGEGGTVWTTDNASYIPLYTQTFDPETGKITVGNNSTWKNGLQFYFDTYRSGDVARRLTRFGSISCEVGTLEDLSIKPLSYELADGLVLPVEYVNPLDEQIIPSGVNFVPVTSTSGVL